LTRPQQRQVLQKQVDDAINKGAKLLLGGRPTSHNGAGYYFQPTVLTSVNHSMEVMRDESFGPIIGIQTVKSDDEAVELMNDTEYGLTSAIYTNDQKRAENFLEKMNSGSVYWNCCDRVSPYVPWSGRRKSGLGYLLSKEGFKSLMQPKAWHLKKPPQ